MRPPSWVRCRLPPFNTTVRGNARWSRPEFPGFVEEVHAEAAQRSTRLFRREAAGGETIEVPLVAAGTGVQRRGGTHAQFRTQASPSAQRHR